MEIEFKNVSVAGLKSDDKEGIVEAIVSVTGIVDNVRDIIEPGAYVKTLAGRKPKGVWHHSWTEPIAKTLDVKELMPGDPGLPKELPNGQPWPKEAGAVLVKMQFNLEGERGKQAYSDVKFFDHEQEWSIGYNVPQGGSTVEQKSGIRRIKTLEWYEYSPVLFGAMPSARTQIGVKDAQLAFKSLGGAQFAKEEPQDAPDVDEVGQEEQDELVDDLDSALDPEEFDLPEDEEEKTLAGLLISNKQLDPAKIRDAIKALQDLLDDVEGDGEPDEDDQQEKEAPYAFFELKAMEYGSLMDCVKELGLIGVNFRRLVTLFDNAIHTKDADVIQQAAEDVLTELESMSDDDEDGEKSDAIALASSTMGRLLTSPPYLEKSLSKERLAYLEDMGEGEFRELDSYMEDIPGHRGLKSAIDVEAGERAQVTGYSKGFGPALARKAMKSKPKPKSVSDARRAKATAEGNAMPDESYPIENEKDLRNAIRTVGRAKDSEKAKAWIISQAKKLGLEDMLPDDWQTSSSQKKSLIPLAEFENAGIDVKSLVVS